MKSLTKFIKSQIISRNPAFQFPDDLPDISAEWDVHQNDEFGFTLLVKDVSFQKLNYLLSLLISEASQSGENSEEQYSNTYSCKLQKCFAYLIQKENFIEITILQDSDEKPMAVGSAVNLVDKVSEVLEEVGQEVSDIMLKLKAKSKNNVMLDKEFDRLSKALKAPLGKDRKVLLEDLSELQKKFKEP